MTTTTTTRVQHHLRVVAGHLHLDLRRWTWVGRLRRLFAHKDKKRKHAPKLSANRRSSPKRKISPLPRVPHKNLPIRTYDHTDEQIAAIAKAEKYAHFAKKKTEPAPVYTEKQKAWALNFLNTKSQYELHHQPDDYLRTLRKEVEKSKSSKSASGSKSSKSASGKRRDVPQLGEQIGRAHV